MSYAIMAGDGHLAEIAATFACNNSGYVITLTKGMADFCVQNNLKHFHPNIAKVGLIIDFFKKHHIKKLCLVGYVPRPDVSSLIPDFKGIKLMAKIMSNLSDKNIISHVVEFLSKEGLYLVGIDEILPDLVAQVGTLHATDRLKTAIDSGKIDTAIGIMKRIGELDIGQSIIYGADRVLSVEAEGGTDFMIDEFIRLRSARNSNVSANALNVEDAMMIKLPKPIQDLRIDMPVVGDNTIEKLKDAGVVGLVIAAKKTVLMNRDKMLDLAQKYNIFIECVV